MSQQKTDAEICRTFDIALTRLEHQGIRVRSDTTFHLFAGEILIGVTETVDGLTAFADALDYSNSKDEGSSRS